MRRTTIVVALMAGSVALGGAWPGPQSAAASPLAPSGAATVRGQLVGEAPLDWVPLPGPLGRTEGAPVLQAVSGDTLDLYYDDGRVGRVRLLGLDAPDVESGCFGLEASVRARQLLNGARVLVEADAPAQDAYGVPLRYVWQATGVLANTLLVGEGQARVSGDADAARLGDELRAAEARAQWEARGLWLACSVG